jgi:hypothetical protein
MNVVEAFILKTQAGQWSFEVRQDDDVLGGGGGYADQFDAIEAAQDAFPDLCLKFVVGNENEGA